MLCVVSPPAIKTLPYKPNRAVSCRAGGEKGWKNREREPEREREAGGRTVMGYRTERRKGEGARLRDGEKQRIVMGHREGREDLKKMGQ